jgi:hypothetical protein
VGLERLWWTHLKRRLNGMALMRLAREEAKQWCLGPLGRGRYKKQSRREKTQKSLDRRRAAVRSNGLQVLLKRWARDRRSPFNVESK